MNVEQVYTLVNTVTQELLGDTAVVNEDLSNVVDIGKAIFDVTSMDKYVGTLVNQIGKIMFVNRPYTGVAPSLLMESWEFGSIKQKIQCELPVAVQNDSWQLVNGQSYPMDTFKPPVVSEKFWNSMTTFDIDISITEIQVKQSFQNATQLNSFISMIYTSVDKALSIRISGLIKHTLNVMIAKTIVDDYTGGVYNASSGVKAVNLLYLYNQQMGTALTKDQCIYDPEFIRFAAYKMGLYMDRLREISDLFNVEAKSRFTTSEYLNVIMLSEFKQAASSYLQSDTFHNQYTALPNAETVSFWQGSGTDYGFASTSSINVTHDTVNLEIDGILAVMFDRDAVAVCNTDTRVKARTNERAEFINLYYKYDVSFFADTAENFIVFFVQ